MKLVEIEMVDAERCDAALAGFSQMLGAAVWHPAGVGPCQSAFRADTHPRPVAGPGRKRPSNQTLVVPALVIVPAISVRSVEKLDARVKRRVKDRDRTRLIAIRLGREPHAAEAWNTHADDPNRSFENGHLSLRHPGRAVNRFIKRSTEKPASL